MNKSPGRRWAVLLPILGLITSQASFAQCENPVGLDDIWDELDIGFTVDPAAPQPDIMLAAQGLPTRGFISMDVGEVGTVQCESDHFLTYLWIGGSPFNAPTPEERIQKVWNLRARLSQFDLFIDGLPVTAEFIETEPEDGFDPREGREGDPMANMFVGWVSEPYSLAPGFHEVTMEFFLDATFISGSINFEVLDAPGLHSDSQTQSEDLILGPSDPVPNQFFGWRVAIDGDFAVVGAPRERRNDSAIRDEGAAYVYRRHTESEPCPGNAAWCEEAKLTPPLPTETYRRVRLGSNVAISGDTIIAGASRYRDPYIDDSGTSNTGAAYVWRRCAPESWCFEGKLTASDGAAGDFFGNNLAIYGDTAFIGSSQGSVGAVYIFTRTGSTWAETYKLSPPTNDPFQNFSTGVSVSADTLLVGASGDSSRTGAAYVFTRTGSDWVQQAKLVASDGQAFDQFGSGVAVFGDTAVVSGPRRINGVCQGGAAYVFTRSDNVWQEQAKIPSPNGTADDCFGFLVALSGNTLVIPADLEDVPGQDAGAAYVYRGAGANWSAPTRIAPSVSLGFDAFGWGVALDGATAVLGAPVSTFNWQGRAGAAYIFSVNPSEAGVNLLNNPGFEDGPGTDPQNPGDLFNVPSWLNIGSATVGLPATGAEEGVNAVELSVGDPSNNNLAFIFQRKVLNRLLTARPGQEFYASAHVLRETAPAGRSIGEMGLAFFDGFGNVIDDMAPASISKGDIGGCPFPTIAARSDTDIGGVVLNEWERLQSQGVAAGVPGSEYPILIDCMVKAPADAVEVGLFLFNINLTGASAPIWFDNVILARLDPDNDEDRLENGIDTDPLNSSADFSDGTTSGTITYPGDQTLTINDEPSPDGVRIIASASGGLNDATISVCDGTASLTFSAADESVVTCGSVQVLVIEGEVEMEVEVNGETAIVSVPADNVLMFVPETETEPATFSAPETNPGTILVIVGGAEVPVAPGQTVEDIVLVEIDIKPGSDPNCLNINGNGVIPVAILGSELFDVGDIYQDNLSFGGLGVRMRGKKGPLCGLEDINGDGFSDLVCHFEDDTSHWIAGSSTATLIGERSDGTSFAGTDSICVVR